MNHGRVLAAAKEDQEAIDKAAHLIRELAAAELPDGASEDFPLPGTVTVTAITVPAIDGEEGYSVTPDRCTLNIDIRTTPPSRALRPPRC